MRKMLAALTAALAIPAHAFTVGTPQVYGNLTWSTTINAPGYAGCNHLVLDAMGDLANSTRLAFYGTLNCPPIGGYTMSGSGYLATDGSISITMTIGIGTVISCPRLVNFGGTCTVYDSAGFARGTAILVFR